MEALLREIRYAIKSLLHRPGFTLVAVVTLALGIGANTAIFSVVDRLILNPLPFKDGERYVSLWLTMPQGGVSGTPSAEALGKWRAELKSFDSIEAFAIEEYSLTGDGEPEVIKGGLVTPAMLSFLGVGQQLGRTLLPEDAQPGAEKVALISNDLWQRRYGSDRLIIGRRIILRDEPYTVIGVLAPEFRQLPFSRALISGREQVLLPLPLDPAKGGIPISMVVGRLKRGVAAPAAQAEMDAFSAQLGAADPQYKGRVGKIITIAENIGKDARRAVLVLLAAAGFVLLIACANVANLLLARGAARSKEFAIRAALGSSRLALIRQLLIESLLLALGGGATGMLLAFWGLDLIVRFRPEKLAQLDDLGLDGTVLGFSLLLSILTSLMCGILPAFSNSRTDLEQVLKQGGRLSSGGGQNFFKKALVVAEVALSIVLLIGAGLMIRSIVRLQSVNPGFDAENVISMRLNLPKSRYPNGAQQQEFFQQLLTRVRRLPDVQAADITTQLPMQLGLKIGKFEIEGRVLAPETLPSFFFAAYCGPDYFRVMRIPVLEGASFSPQDDTRSPRTVLINEQMARRFWPGESPVGKRFRFDEGDWHTVIGVAGNVKSVGLDRSLKSDQIFYSARQFPVANARVVARVNRNPAGLAPLLRGQVQELDANLPVREMKTMEQMLGESLSQQRFNLALLSVFSILALVLAAVGIYGLLSWSVTQLTREIGIRMALGAQRNDVLKLVVGQGLVLILMGLAIGVAGAFGLTRLMASLLFGVKATDPLTFALVPIVLMAVALLACYVPARRAMKVDPLVALRCE